MVCYDRTIFGWDTTFWKSGTCGCKIAFTVVRIKSLAMHVTNQKIKFWYIYGRKCTKYIHGTWSLLNTLMIVGIKEKSIILYLYKNVLLAIATNIPVLLLTGFVVQGHKCSMWCLFVQLWVLPQSAKRSKCSWSRNVQAIYLARYWSYKLHSNLFWRLLALLKVFFVILTAIHYDPDTTEPISCCLKSLDELLLWKRNEASPFNVATVPLASRYPPLHSCPRRTLVSHDMMGGYLEDRYNSGFNWFSSMLYQFH